MERPMTQMVQPERIRAECPRCKQVAWFVFRFVEHTGGSAGGLWTCQNCGYHADFAELDPLRR
jgi:transposase